MRILNENQYSNLSNDNVKWHLVDEMLWITKYNEYKVAIKECITNIL